MTKNRPTDPDYKPKDNRPPITEDRKGYFRRVGDGQDQPSADIDVISGPAPVIPSRRPPGLDKP